eukprot:CAMPEP_0202386398 /NCGR_PEP_ID=MMETSP1127-20130417/66103_1 /ASSEMBLY_ACC=CAM_ASM_000462 /TAXON_ID=3047 /ORGANISM="Dunaliella tertiolecta, Strain CCMP1320" /LENGTH=44 /DNA_ID= /DNA_START= /DNA_END= /DNA_ORIENTATION=
MAKEGAGMEAQRVGKAQVPWYMIAPLSLVWFESFSAGADCRHGL